MGRKRRMRRSLQALAAFFLMGCAAIDTTPLDEQDFYRRTQVELRNLKSRQNPEPPAGRLRAGAARIEITPAPGVPLAGYGNRLGRGATGTHDRLYVRALALSDGRQTVILITGDLLAITNDLSEAVHEKVARRIPIQREALMISATHTHSGPGAIAKRFWEEFAAGPFDPALFETIAQKMARAALEAHENMQPASLWGDQVPAPDLIQNRMLPSGPVDPDLSFLSVRTQHGQAIFLVNYSAHPTVLPSANYLFSGDFPGALQRKLEARTGGVALYTAGAVGDQGPHPPAGRDPFDQAEKTGQLLAGKVLQAPQGMALTEKIPFRAARISVPLPPTQVKTGERRRLASALGDFFFDRETVLQAFRVGDFLLLGVPCDLSAEIGLEIKARAARHGLKVIIVGFANDYVGYVIPNEYYGRDFYEARMSFNGPFMGEYFKEIGIGLVEALADGP